MKQTMGHNWDEHEPVDRDKLGPFVNGYIREMLKSADNTFTGTDVPFEENYNKHDIAERALCQMIRDCVGFYWRHRVILEELYKNEELTEKQAGGYFWASRNDGNAFGSIGEDSFDVCWGILESGAIGFGPSPMFINDDNEIDLLFNMTQGWYYSGSQI